MAYINKVQISTNDNSYLIEPTLFASASGTGSALTANISDFGLVTGSYVNITITQAISANATLNISSTGAKTIYYDGAPIIAGSLTVGRTYTFVYDGAHWVVIGDLTESNIIIGTTSYWQQHNTYIAPLGTIIVYTDHGSYTSNNNTITVPGIKISDGLAYAIDLPFVGDDVAAAIRSELNNHINDNIRHITSTERTFWNNKLNCDIDGENLQFNRQ